MPTAVATEVRAYAHCINPLCPGYGQEEVPAISTETSFTFRDHGDNSALGSMVFRSFVELRYAVDADEETNRDEYVEQYRAAAACRTCERPRELTATQRPTYLPLSGHDPMGLLGAPAFDPSVKNTEADAKIAALEAQLNRMQALLEAKLGGDD